MYRVSLLCLFVAATAAPGFAQDFDPGDDSCDGKPEGSACWMEIANHPQCYLWSPGLQLTPIRHMERCVSRRPVRRQGYGHMDDGDRRVDSLRDGRDAQRPPPRPVGGSGGHGGRWRGDIVQGTLRCGRRADRQLDQAVVRQRGWGGAVRRRRVAGSGPSDASGTHRATAAGPDGPICTGDYSPNSCWMEITGKARMLPMEWCSEGQ